MDIKLKVADALFERLKVSAEENGFSSAESYAVWLLEEALKGGSDPDGEVARKLKDLGYM